MDPTTQRQRLRDARVGRLATIGPEGGPHLVPCCFVLVEDTIYSAVDAKPKSTLALRRLANLAANPAASLLVDHYDDEDWSALWWIRVDGQGRVTTSKTEHDQAITALQTKYAQYRRTPPPGPVIALRITRWRAWP